MQHTTIIHVCYVTTCTCSVGRAHIREIGMEPLRYVQRMNKNWFEQPEFCCNCGFKCPCSADRAQQRWKDCNKRKEKELEKMRGRWFDLDSSPENFVSYWDRENDYDEEKGDWREGATARWRFNGKAQKKRSSCGETCQTMIASVVRDESVPATTNYI